MINTAVRTMSDACPKCGGTEYICAGCANDESELTRLLGAVEQAVSNFNFDTGKGSRAAMRVLKNALIYHYHAERE